MSGLHGECPPHALQSLLGISQSDANRYVSQLIAEGIIKPSPVLQQSASRVLNGKEDSVFDKVKKRFDMKSKAKTGELKVCETIEATDCVDAVEETPENVSETTNKNKLPEANKLASTKNKFKTDQPFSSLTDQNSGS